MIAKRLVLAAISLVSALVVSLTVDAQDPRAGKIARIGRLSPLSAETDAPNLEAFRKGLRDLGWVEGRHLTIESRFADGKVDRFPGLATELVLTRADHVVQ